MGRWTRVLASVCTVMEAGQRCKTRCLGGAYVLSCKKCGGKIAGSSSTFSASLAYASGGTFLDVCCEVMLKCCVCSLVGWQLLRCSGGGLFEPVQGNKLAWFCENITSRPDERG